MFSKYNINYRTIRSDMSYSKFSYNPSQYIYIYNVHPTYIRLINDHNIILSVQQARHLLMTPSIIMDRSHVSNIVNPIQTPKYSSVFFLLKNP